MAKKLKLSPWHDGSVKPVHVGLYQVDYAGSVKWCWWSSEGWGWAYKNKERSTSKIWRNPEGAVQNKTWRGVLK